MCFESGSCPIELLILFTILQKAIKRSWKKVNLWGNKKEIYMLGSKCNNIPIKQSCIHKFCQSISTECCRFRIQTSRYRFFRCHHYTFAERIFQCLLITPAGNSRSQQIVFFSHSKSVSNVYMKSSAAVFSDLLSFGTEESVSSPLVNSMLPR